MSRHSVAIVIHDGVKALDVSSPRIMVPPSPCRARSVWWSRRSAGAANRSSAPICSRRRPPPGSPVAKAQSYVMAHPSEAFPVERLAVIAGTSERSIARLFTSELGVTPHAFVESVRIDHARNLLEATDLPLKAIAYDCGFGQPEQMRVVFQRRLGVGPAGYRASFKAP